ncbi:MAG: hypothetical protein V4760_08095 [Bdellovibrionota bacterium]
MERRQFLKLMSSAFGQSALVGLTGCVALPKRARVSSAAAQDLGVISLVRRGHSKDTSILTIYDWSGEASSVTQIPLNNPHSMLRSAAEPSVIYVFESLGSAARIDLGSGNVLKVDHRLTREPFFGHAFQTPDGRRLLCSQFDTKARLLVTVRSAADLSYLGELPRECDFTHHVVGLPGTSIAVCGQFMPSPKRKRAGVVFYDYERMRTERVVDLDDGILHLLPLSSEELIGVGYKVRPGTVAGRREHPYEDESRSNVEAYKTVEALPAPVYRLSSKGLVEKYWDLSRPEDYKIGFGLAKVGEGGHFITGHKGSNVVRLWRDFKVVKEERVTQPTTMVVSRDGSRCLVVSQGKGIVFATETLERLAIVEGERDIVIAAAY